MRSKQAYWFEASIKALRMAEDGCEKRVSEVYCIDATSFGEAERRIMKELASEVRGGIEVKNINPAPYKEVFFCDSDAGNWFKAKLSFLTADDNGKEKRSNVTYLVQADTIEDAMKNVEKVMVSGAGNYIMATIAETKVVDVFER